MKNNLSYSRKLEIELIYGYNVRVFTDWHIRVSDGDKELDLFKNRFHELETNKRGYFSDYLIKIEEYFLYEK